MAERRQQSETTRRRDRRRDRKAATGDTPERLAERRRRVPADREPGDAAKEASIRIAAQSAPLGW